MSVNTHEMSSHDLWFSFLQHCTDNGEVLTTVDLLYMIEKPWRYEREFGKYVEKIEKEAPND